MCVFVCVYVYIYIYITYLFTYLLRGAESFLRSSPAFSQSRNSLHFMEPEFTSARHPFLSSASSIQSILSHPTSWRYILILFSYIRLDLPSGLFPSGFPTKNLYATLLSTIRATCSAHLILLDMITRTILVRSTHY